MHRRLIRVLALLLTLAVVAAACGGDDDSESTDDGAATDEGFDAETDGGGDTDAGAVADGDADPALVEQIGAAYLGAPMDPEAAQCLVDVVDADDELSAALAGLAGGQPIESGPFNSLTLGVRDCAGIEPIVGSLTTTLAFGAERDDLNGCLNTELAGSDEALVAISAVVLGVQLPPEETTAAVPVLATCVPDDLLADQLAGSYESRNGFAIAVDRDCMLDAVAELESTESFWNAFIGGGSDQAALDAVDELAAGCGDDPFADLLAEVPADFEPWAGDGALAAVAPPARDGAYAEAPPTVIDADATYQAVITTADGEMVFDLFTDTAPITVNNFVALARDGYYDGVSFHRVLADFMAQGGDPTGAGSGGPGYQFEDEVDGGPAMDRRGLLAMANAGPGTNGSQFFITFAAAEHLTGNHTIFGELVEGDDVLAAIDLRDPAAPTGRGEIIESIEIIES